MNTVNLTNEELFLLDGKCSPKVQEAIVAAKERCFLAFTYGLSDKASVVMLEIITHAQKNGSVDFAYHTVTGSRFCPVCGEQAGYKAIKRGINKGKVNYNNPKYLSGVKIGVTFICMDCYIAMRNIIVSNLSAMTVQLHPELATNGTVKYVKVFSCRCTKCNWKGYEHQLVPVPALGPGYYAGQCPSCGAAKPEMSFNNVIEWDFGSWVVVERSEHATLRKNNEQVDNFNKIVRTNT